ncbi:MAG TPA: CHAT domain-containing protein, partial [Thermoanaerobaculia bacterium]|nr:CHAT domain-containing protein [Thermoanaerobaculia bacterium]
HLGSVYRDSGDEQHAAASYEDAIKEADRLQVAEVRWQARNELGVLLGSERYFSEAIDLLEEHQNEIALAELRPNVLAAAVMWRNPYDDYIDFLLRQNRAADAFFIAERERGREFLKSLSESHDAFTPEERQLVGRIKTAQAVLRSATVSDAKRADVVASIGRYESELSDLRLKLAVDHPSLAHARYPKLLHAAGVQSQLLAPDEALIAFYLGAKQSVAWVITRESLRTILLPAARDIDVRPVIAALRNPESRDRESIAALSRALQMDALLSAAGKQRVIVIPHGVLYDVPFEALVDAKGRMVVERCAVSYAPSASSLAFLRSSPHAANAPVSLIAVANPIVGAHEAAMLRQIDLAHVNLLSPLPRTSEEARDIGAAVILEGANATRSQLARLSDARVIHFATHGLIDEERPDRSGLVLTADPPHDDGLLQVRDIYALHLNADLVTLSACDTALGQNVTGEGIVGLTRAFFFAGARSVVASLWDVEDAATARLMQRFYTNLDDGQPIDVALQHAKLDFVRSGASPFFWASFVASGNARPSIATADRSDRIRAAMVLVTIAALAYFAIVKL